ncbi:MAG: hypothetical protein QOF61_1170 [Acidobacteriota bacterium]|jgi:hypothetical protein|nr:hypothetical protein [Acidobacteriota bacterium]
MEALFSFSIATVLFLLPSPIVRRASLSFASQNALAVKASKYVGLKHGSHLPDNLKGVGGASISSMGDAKEYGINEVHQGRVKMLWFEHMTYRDDSGAPNWEVKDVLVLPTIPRNKVLVYSFCSSGKKPDSEIVAIADYQPDEEFFTRVRRAWRANRKTEKFEEISPRSIRCTNEGYGV